MIMKSTVDISTDVKEKWLVNLTNFRIRMDCGSDSKNTHIIGFIEWNHFWILKIIYFQTYRDKMLFILQIVCLLFKHNITQYVARLSCIFQKIQSR